MDSVQQLKLTQFNTNQKQTGSSIGRSIASLNNDIAAAIEHQAYARVNPDGVVDAGLLSVMGYSVDQLMAQFAEVAEKQTDLLAVKDGTMTPEALVTKYNIDLSSYSNSLI
tara:strand:+ start:146 stop:478 length:333 start_codon:yes stop_codon:yes gene_type:complete